MRGANKSPRNEDKERRLWGVKDKLMKIKRYKGPSQTLGLGLDWTADEAPPGTARRSGTT